VKKSWVGPIVTAAIVAGVGVIFALNRETGAPPGLKPVTGSGGAAPARPQGFREYPIGDEVIKNHLQIAAVWLPSVGMAGMPEPSADVIHIEADIRATAGNPNGLAKDAFLPYLKVEYGIVEAATGRTLQSGDLLPMFASDGVHYGANASKPSPGSYRLVYKIEPPSARIGRHTDPVGGVAPWWDPFEASFDWVVEPSEVSSAVASIPPPGR